MHTEALYLSFRFHTHNIGSYYQPEFRENKD
jgi:hypothetical protein